jgi:hypothetical protein
MSDRKPYEGKDKMYDYVRKHLTPAQEQFLDMHLYIHTDLLTLKEARDKCLVLLDIKPKKGK